MDIVVLRRQIFLLFDTTIVKINRCCVDVKEIELAFFPLRDLLTAHHLNISIILAHGITDIALDDDRRRRSLTSVFGMFAMATSYLLYSLRRVPASVGRVQWAPVFVSGGQV
jgi:hypothetical protein